MERKKIWLMRSWGELAFELADERDVIAAQRWRAMICPEVANMLVGRECLSATLHVSGGPFLGAKKVRIRWDERRNAYFYKAKGLPGGDTIRALGETWEVPKDETEVTRYFRLDKRGGKR